MTQTEMEEKLEEEVKGLSTYLDGDDYTNMQDLRTIIRSRLGWQYNDPKVLEEWFTEQQGAFVDKRLLLDLERLETALKVVKVQLERLT